MPGVSRRGRRSVSRRPRRARGSVSRGRRSVARRGRRSVARRGQGFLSGLKQSLTRSSARPKTIRTQRRPPMTRNRKRRLAPLPKYGRTQSPKRRFTAPPIMNRTTQHKTWKQIKVTGV